MNAQRDIQTEVASWTNKVPATLHPATGEMFRVLCSWTEIFPRPFKFRDERIGTYVSSDNYVTEIVTLVPKKEHLHELETYIREVLGDNYLYQEIDTGKSFWRTVGNFFEKIVGQHSGKIKENVWKDIPGLKEQQTSIVLLNFPDYLELAKNNSTSKYKVTIQRKNLNNLGTLTGRYYFDFFGYCWFEVEPLLFSASRAWLRETAIDYDSKSDMQGWIESNRPKTTESNKARNLGFLLTAVSIVLSSR